MNKNLIIYFLIITSANLYSQKQYGYIITKKNDTIKCDIKVYEEGVITAYKTSIKYWINDKKNSISIDQIDQIILDDNKYSILETSYEDWSDPIDTKIINEKRIVKRINEGLNKMYEYFVVRCNYDQVPGALGDCYLVNYKAIATSKGNFLLSQGFKTTVKKAFANCPQILKNLKSKKYKRKNISDVIKDANELCN